jgi:very-short-patch-repair endonuclease
MCTADAPMVVSFRELSSSGFTRRAIRQAVANGSLRVLRRGVFAREGACDVVAEAAAHGGSLACVTAARHLGLWVSETEEPTHVWLRAHGRSYPHAGCRCVPHWDDGSTHDVFGLPTVPRVLRQILLCRGIEEFFVTLESARRQGMLTASGLKWLRKRVGPAGRDAIAYSRDDADSGLESLLRWRLRPHGLAVRTQVKLVSVGRVDFVIGERLIVEVDGAPNHDGESHRHRDLVRDANAAAWGYVTLRFDYAMVVYDWPTVELAILGHVDGRLHLA